MDELQNRYNLAKSAYQKLINEDFPDFVPEAYLHEKDSETSCDSQDDVRRDSKEEKPEKKKFSIFDFNGDGKLDLGDIAYAAKQAKEAAVTTAQEASEKIKSFDAAEFKSNAQSAAERAEKTVSTAARNAGEALSEFDLSDASSSARDAIAGAEQAVASIDLSGVASTAAKIGKTAVGVQGIQDRNESKHIQEICGEYYDAAEAVTEQRRLELNYAITNFGEYRLRALHQTVGRFLQYLKDLKQNNAAKEYEILMGAEINTEHLEEMERVDMAASEVLRTTTVAGLFGRVAVLGTPALVMTSVGALATASTGTAISTLSGAAATNATMAWLGGGSLAAGGGGMAAGAAVLTGITVGATAVTAILAAGTMISLHYGKKLTEVKEYEKEVGVAVANFEKAWIVMNGISARTEELREVTEELKWRASNLLDELEPLIPDFDFANKESLKVFNKCAQLIKATVELAQTALLDDEGNLSTDSMEISGKIRKVLNTEV